MGTTKRVRGKSQWEQRYDALLASATADTAKHLEERIRLQTALTSAVNAQLTEETFLTRLTALEAACASLKQALWLVQTVERRITDLLSASAGKAT
jgi:2,4-dienoyl-CoA reductase-like NADH-dependent reductase (Old Yellow Enzyme family)